METESKAPQAELPAVVGKVEERYLIDPAAFEHGQRVAKMFASSKLVPETFRGDVASCFLVLHMAQQLKIDPVFLMSHAYVVHGKPAVDAQVVIALINGSGKYQKDLDFRFTGAGDTRACTAFALLPTGEEHAASCDVKTAKAAGWWEKNKNWQALTDQMLSYRAATFFGRRYCPHLLAGFRTQEEIVDIDGVMVVGGRPQSTGAAELNKRITSESPAK